MSGAPRPRVDDPCDEDEVLAAVARSNDEPPLRAFARGTFERVPPIYFIGDSRTMPFRNALYTSELTARSYQLRSLHLRALHAADFYSAPDGLNAPLIDALATDQTIVTNDEGAHWHATPWEDTAGVSAPLVLFCGPYDAHRLMDEIGPDADIVAWDERSHACDRSALPASRLVPVEEVLQRPLEIMEPFAAGIDALRAIGFGRIFVHGIPPALRAERFERMYGHAKGFRQYHPNAIWKVQMLFDTALRTIAARTGSRYVAGPVDASGSVPPEATWDDVHYSVTGARDVARSIVDVLEGVVE